MSAAEPATTGVAADVPDTAEYPPPFVVVQIPTPGAEMPTKLPYVEKLANRSFESVAETTIRELFDDVLSNVPVFPEAT